MYICRGDIFFFIFFILKCIYLCIECTLYAYCDGATVSIISSQLCKQSLRNSQHRVVMWFTQLTRHDTNNCNNKCIRLSNIFMQEEPSTSNVKIFYHFCVLFGNVDQLKTGHMTFYEKKYCTYVTNYSNTHAIYIERSKFSKN